ncbi:MAG: nucleoside triphosphate pyrophosphohydrolase [Firmicutes bacterium]|nr:nucleoside triphosphate pyrophosphohydrolase [Bacillota bacterium]
MVYSIKCVVHNWECMGGFGLQDNNGRTSFPLDPIVEVMAKLRAQDGCPWDREQDHQSLTPYLLEETYEVLDALEQGDMYKFCEELGDLLLQIVFHAQIASENGYFTINDVVTSITEKMIRRHPHVFGDVTVENSSQVLDNWEKIKQGEKDGGDRAKSVLDNIPRGLPALLRASKVQEKAARVGFDWPDYRGPWDKINEEQDELLAACRTGNRELIQHELGDLLFSVVNFSRFFQVNGEVALNGTVEKFVRRFQYIERAVREKGEKIEECSLEKLDSLWEKAKKAEN